MVTNECRRFVRGLGELYADRYGSVSVVVVDRCGYRGTAESGGRSTREEHNTVNGVLTVAVSRMKFAEASSAFVGDQRVRRRMGLMTS